MTDEQLVPETKGVTVKLLAPLHDHKDRPGTVYVLQGTITDHRNGVATDYGPGVGWPEDRNTLHWLENRGSIPAVEISVDIVKKQQDR